jgi:hypothetical protein
VGVIVTACDAMIGPLQPAAVAVITDVPLHNAVNVTWPVEETIELPAATEAASRLYVMPDELRAEAEYVTEPAPWHLEDVLPGVNTGAETEGIIETVCEAVSGPLQPLAEAVITEMPYHSDMKLTAPVDVLIVFPAAMEAASRE